jgi:hypothetical protein
MRFNQPREEIRIYGDEGKHLLVRYTCADLAQSDEDWNALELAIDTNGSGIGPYRKVRVPVAVRLGRRDCEMLLAHLSLTQAFETGARSLETRGCQRPGPGAFLRTRTGNFPAPPVHDAHFRGSRASWRAQEPSLHARLRTLRVHLARAGREADQHPSRPDARARVPPRGGGPGEARRVRPDRIRGRKLSRSPHSPECT